jgi:hypothetical protein
METIIQWIKWAVESLVDIIKEALLFITKPIYELLRSVFYFIYDSFLSLVEFAFGLIDFKNDLFDLTLGWTSLPSQMIYILNECGVDNLIAVLVAAMGIRLLLNLIPSWATRV